MGPPEVVVPQGVIALALQLVHELLFQHLTSLWNPFKNYNKSTKGFGF
jgi:hypothetical protein